MSNMEGSKRCHAPSHRSDDMPRQPLTNETHTIFPAGGSIRPPEPIAEVMFPERTEL